MEKIVADILNEIEKYQHDNNVKHIIVAIDGRCASGKSTVARTIQEITNCNVFHMDDFFLRPEQRTMERYKEVGGNVDYERFLEQVLVPLRDKQEICYQPFCCKTLKLKDKNYIKPNKLNIVEGCYSCHPKLWDYYDVHLFLTVNYEEQVSRIEKRNGVEQLEVFKQRWIPLEEEYFNQLDIMNRCERAFLT